MFINRFPLYFAQSAISYGYFGGGVNSSGIKTNIIDYINKLLTTGNALDRGDLTSARGIIGGNLYSSSYGFWGVVLL